MMVTIVESGNARRRRPKPRHFTARLSIAAVVCCTALSGHTDTGGGAAAFGLQVSPAEPIATSSSATSGMIGGRRIGPLSLPSRRLWAYVDPTPPSSPSSGDDDGKKNEKRRQPKVKVESPSSSSSAPPPSWLDPNRAIGDILPEDDTWTTTSTSTTTSTTSTSSSASGVGASAERKDGGVFVVGPGTRSPASASAAATATNTDDDGAVGDGASVSSGVGSKKEVEAEAKAKGEPTSDIGGVGAMAADETTPSSTSAAATPSRRRASATDAAKAEVEAARAMTPADKIGGDNEKESRVKAAARRSSGLEKMGFGSASSRGDGGGGKQVVKSEETAVASNDNESSGKSSRVKVSEVVGGADEKKKKVFVASAASAASAPSSSPSSDDEESKGGASVATSIPSDDKSKSEKDRTTVTKETKTVGSSGGDDTTSSSGTMATSATSELLEERDEWMDRGDALPEGTVPGSDFHTVDVEGEVEVEDDGLVEKVVSSSSSKKKGIGSSATAVLSEKDEWIDSIASGSKTADEVPSSSSPEGARSSPSAGETTTTLVDPPSISSGIGGGGNARVDGADGGSTGGVKAAAISSAALHSLGRKTTGTRGQNHNQKQSEQRRSPPPPQEERKDEGKKSSVERMKSHGATITASAHKGKTEGASDDEETDAPPHPPSLEEMMFPSLAAKSNQPSSLKKTNAVSDSDTVKREAKPAPVPQLYDALSGEWVEKKEGRAEGPDVDSWLRKSPSASSSVKKEGVEGASSGSNGPSIGDMMFPALMSKETKKKRGGSSETDIVGEGEAKDSVVGSKREGADPSGGEKEAVKVADDKIASATGDGIGRTDPPTGRKKRTISPANMTAGVRPRAAAAVTVEDGISSRKSTGAKDKVHEGEVDQRKEDSGAAPPVEATVSSGKTVGAREELEKGQKETKERKPVKEASAPVTLPVATGATTTTNTASKSGKTEQPLTAGDDAKSLDSPTIRSDPAGAPVPSEGFTAGLPLDVVASGEGRAVDGGESRSRIETTFAPPKPIVAGEGVVSDPSKPLPKPAFVVKKSSSPGGGSGEMYSPSPSPSSALAVNNPLAFFTPYTNIDEMMDLSEGYVLECATGNLLRAAIGSAKTAAYAAESLLDAITRREVVDGAGEAVASLSKIVRGSDRGGDRGGDGGEELAADDASPPPAGDVLGLSKTALASAGSAVGAAVRSLADADSTRCALEATAETTRGVLTATLALGVWGVRRLNGLVRWGVEERTRASTSEAGKAEMASRREEMMAERDLQELEQEPGQPGITLNAKEGEMQRRETEQNVFEKKTRNDEYAPQGKEAVVMSKAEEEKQRRIEEAYAASLRRVEEEVAASVGRRVDGVEEDDDDTIPNSSVVDTRRLSKTAFFFADKK